MPRLNIDYSKTIIYKIACKDVSVKDIYVGSTTDFIKRKAQHKSLCNNPNSSKHNFYVYQIIRANGGWDNWSMVEEERFNCVDKLSQSKRERYWLEKLNATLNKQVPSRTDKEYYEDNKVKIAKYLEDNKAHISATQKAYYEKKKLQLLQQNPIKFFKEYMATTEEVNV